MGGPAGVVRPAQSPSLREQAPNTFLHSPRSALLHAWDEAAPVGGDGPIVSALLHVPAHGRSTFRRREPQPSSILHDMRARSTPRPAGARGCQSSMSRPTSYPHASRYASASNRSTAARCAAPRSAARASRASCRSRARSTARAYGSPRAHPAASALRLAVAAKARPVRLEKNAGRAPAAARRRACARRGARAAQPMTYSGGAMQTPSSSRSSVPGIGQAVHRRPDGAAQDQAVERDPARGRARPSSPIRSSHRHAISPATSGPPHAQLGGGLVGPPAHAPPRRERGSTWSIVPDAPTAPQ